MSFQTGDGGIVAPISISRFFQAPVDSTVSRPWQILEQMQLMIVWSPIQCNLSTMRAYCFSSELEVAAVYSATIHFSRMTLMPISPSVSILVGLQRIGRFF